MFLSLQLVLHMVMTQSAQTTATIRKLTAAAQSDQKKVELDKAV